MAVDWRTEKPVTAYLLDLFEKQMVELGEKPTPLSERLAGHAKVFQNLRSGRSPSPETVKAVAEALRLELYVGPPRPVSDDPSTHAERGPLQVRGFDTGTTPGGFVWAEVQTPDGPVRLLLATETSKALGASLTHRAMQIEEDG